MKQIPITGLDEFGSDLEVFLSVQQCKPAVKCQKGVFSLVMSLTQQEFEAFDFEKCNPIPNIPLDDPNFIFTPSTILDKIKNLQTGFITTGPRGGVLIWKKIK